MWVLGNSTAMAAVQILGISIAQSSWGAMVAIISFAWGMAWGDTPKNLPLTIAGLAFLICGIFTLAYVSSKTNEDDSQFDDEPLVGRATHESTTDGRRHSTATDRTRRHQRRERRARAVCC